MSENSKPEQPGTPTNVPAGYDKPATPTYQTPEAPIEQQPEAPTYPQAAQAPTYPQPGAPTYPQPGAQQGYDQQNVQAGYPQPGMQQGYGQQPAYGMAYGTEQKSKIVAGILGILLGSLGIHNFYLGKTKIALIQLLVSVLSLGFLAPFMGIWGLVEGILILVGNEGYRTDAKGIPLKD
ncbi:TM2 domain-containing protein [Arthrobacter sp. TMN-49]